MANPLPFNSPISAGRSLCVMVQISTFKNKCENDDNNNDDKDDNNNYTINNKNSNNSNHKYNNKFDILRNLYKSSIPININTLCYHVSEIYN